jgi:hypothetical protein
MTLEEDFDLLPAVPPRNREPVAGMDFTEQTVSGLWHAAADLLEDPDPAEQTKVVVLATIAGLDADELTRRFG